MLDISVTLFVLNLLKSKDFKFIQLENKFDILVTKEVSNLDKSKDETELQSLNMEDISNALDVLKFPVVIFFKA